MFDAVSHLKLILKCDGAMQVCRNGLRNVMALCKFAGTDYETWWRYAVYRDRLRNVMALCNCFTPLHAYILTTRKRRGICKKSSVRKDFEEPSNAI